MVEREDGDKHKKKREKNHIDVVVFDVWLIRVRFSILFILFLVFSLSFSLFGVGDCCYSSLCNSRNLVILNSRENGVVGGSAEQMDKCDERLAIPMVCAGGKFRAAVVLHIEGENDEGSSPRMCTIERCRYWDR